MKTWTGDALRKAMEAEHIAQYPKRDCYPLLADYLAAKPDDRVCMLVGLLWTGKRTMMKQAVCNVGDYEHTLWVRCEATDDIDTLSDTVDCFQDIRYLFVEAVTALKYFLDTSPFISCQYAKRQQQKVVLTGRKSLELFTAQYTDDWCEDAEEPVVIHVRPLGCSEQWRFRHFPNPSCKIRCGGILWPETYAAWTVADYIEEAIVKNICQAKEDLFGSSDYHGGDPLMDDFLSGRLAGMIRKVLLHPEMAADENEKDVLAILRWLDATDLCFDDAG